MFYFFWCQINRIFQEMCKFLPDLLLTLSFRQYFLILIRSGEYIVVPPLLFLILVICFYFFPTFWNLLMLVLWPNILYICDCFMCTWKKKYILQLLGIMFWGQIFYILIDFLSTCSNHFCKKSQNLHLYPWIWSLSFFSSVSFGSLFGSSLIRHIHI